MLKTQIKTQKNHSSNPFQMRILCNGTKLKASFPSCTQKTDCNFQYNSATHHMTYIYKSAKRPQTKRLPKTVKCMVVGYSKGKYKNRETKRKEYKTSKIHVNRVIKSSLARVNVGRNSDRVG